MSLSDICPPCPDSGCCGVDSVSDAVAAAIRDCIARGGTPADIQCCLGDPAAVAASVTEYDLLSVAMWHSNAAFVDYFISILDPSALSPDLFGRAVRLRSDASVLGCLHRHFPSYDPLQLLLLGAERHNFAAMDFALERLLVMPVRAALRSVLPKACFLCDYMWLTERGLTVRDFSWLGVLVGALRARQLDVVEWVEEMRAVPSLNDPDNIERMLVHGGPFALTWLLRRRSPAALFKAAPFACASAALQHGDPAVFAQLPPGWLSCFESRSGSFTGAMLEFAIEGGPASLEAIHADPRQKIHLHLRLMNILMRRASLPSIKWLYHRYSSLDVQQSIAHNAAMHRDIACLDFLFEKCPGLKFWEKIASDLVLPFEVIPWFETRAGVVVFASAGDWERYLWRASGAVSARLDPSFVLWLFDRLPPSESAKLAVPSNRAPSPHRRRVVRLWWQHQRAKLGVLVVALRRSKARRRFAVPVLHEYIAREYLCL
jgi:hypothetical protein